MRDMARRKDANVHRDNLIAAIISLGTLNERSGDKATVSVHFAEVRRMLNSIGGPSKLRSPMLSTVMAHLECLHGTPKASYVWQGKDMQWLLEDVNDFLDKLWRLWNLLDDVDAVVETVGKEQSSSHGLRDAFVLRPESGLHEVFSRFVEQDFEQTTPRDEMELVFQLTCLLDLGLIILDYCTDEGEELREYLDRLHESVEAAQLDSMPCNNHMWLIQAHDQSPEHIKRVWQGAGFTFLLKHTPHRLQLQVRDWLLALMRGEKIGKRKALRLNVFDFSYAR